VSKIRFYTDENVSKAVINGLRQRGIDVLSVPEAQMLKASDEAQLKFARQERRTVFTHDDDFLKLASLGYEHSGIVYASQRLSIGEIIRGLVRITQVLDAEDMRNHIEFL
jgi:predicted nuclease of predicted toxin-antitoxin system